jgi:hypothetical protein
VTFSDLSLSEAQIALGDAHVFKIISIDQLHNNFTRRLMGSSGSDAEPFAPSCAARPTRR